MRKLRRDLVFIFACYSVHASIYAAQLSLWEQLHADYIMMDVFINLMSATCASMANTAFRLKNEAAVVAQVFKELAYGILFGLVAGVITYSIAQAMDANKFLQLALVTLAGWGGAKVIEGFVAKYFSSSKQRGGDL